MKVVYDQKRFLGDGHQTFTGRAVTFKKNSEDGPSVSLSVIIGWGEDLAYIASSYHTKQEAWKDIKQLTDLRDSIDELLEVVVSSVKETLPENEGG